jgi:serine/threonine protein phosphatase PrpC
MLPELFTRTLRFRDPSSRRDRTHFDRYYPAHVAGRPIVDADSSAVLASPHSIEPPPTVELKVSEEPEVILSDSKEAKAAESKAVSINPETGEKAVLPNDDKASEVNETSEAQSSEPTVSPQTKTVPPFDPMMVPPSISLQNITLDPSDKFVSKSLSLQGISSVHTNQQTTTIKAELPFHCFALFDGHAGADVAVTAANQLYRIIQQKLLNIADLLIAFSLDQRDSNLLTHDYRKAQLNSTCQASKDQQPINSTDSLWRAIDRIKARAQKLDSSNPTQIIQDQMLNSQMHWQGSISPNGDKRITVDNLITGALESAFWDFDGMVEHDKIQYRMYGGCTAIVSLFILGKLYVANAGDSR